MLELGPFLVRQATGQDLEDVLRIDKAAFGGLNLKREIFESWLKVYSAGFFVALRHNRIVACCKSIRLWRDNVCHRWKVDTADGTCVTHNEDGNTMYGVSLGSLSSGAGDALCLASRLLAERSGVEEIWLHSRLPGFSAWAKQAGDQAALPCQLQEYVGLHIDPTQLFYEKNGLTVRAGVQGYLPEDVESLGCAAWTIWKNPLRN